MSETTTIPTFKVNASLIDGYIDGLMTARAGGSYVIPSCFSPMASWAWRDGYSAGMKEPEYD